MVPEEILTELHTSENCSAAKELCIPRASPDDFSIAVLSSLHASLSMMMSIWGQLPFYILLKPKKLPLIIFNYYYHYDVATLVQ